METTPPPRDEATRLHQIAKQILRNVSNLRNAVVRIQENDSETGAGEIKKEYVEPFLTSLNEIGNVGDPDPVLARFTRAALALNLHASRRRFRNIESSSVHGLTVQICCFFLSLWERSFALKPGDRVPDNALSADYLMLCKTMTQAVRMMAQTLDLPEQIPDFREFQKVNDPVKVGLRWFMNDCHTCLNEWNPTPFVADLEREFHTATHNDKVIQGLTVTDQKGSKAKGQKKKGTINQRMLEIIQAEPEAMGWNTTQWQRRLKCRSRSAITDTPTWKNLEISRLSAKAEKQKDRQRRYRHRD